jgi:peptide/nickel transport system substrate-binding protein
VPFSEHVYEMLMARNRGPGIEPGSVESSRPAGALAESWEISPDGASITFTMRQNVKFHPIAPVNGRVMDMDDWKTSMERHQAVGVYRSAIADILDKVEFTDARHMVWKMKAPFAPIFDRIYHDKFAFPIQPKELNADPNLAAAKGIGTGYKMIDKYQPSIGFEYKKHVDYWGGEPFIDRWHVPIVPEYANRYALFSAQKIIDFTPTARDVLQLHKDAPQAVIVGEPIPTNNVTRYRFGRINARSQPWGDPRVRVAIRRSIDFKSIGEFLSNKKNFEAEGIPVDMTTMTHVPQDPGYWLDPEKKELGPVGDNYLFSVAEAKKLTAAAGYPDAIPMLYPIRLEQGALAEVDQLTMDSLIAAGTFKLDILRVATASEYNKYRVDQLFTGYPGTSSGSSDDVDYFIVRNYDSKAYKDEYGTAFPDPRIDDFGNRQRMEMDVEKRRAILKDFQKLMAELMPAVPGHHLYTQFHYRWPWVHNINYGTTLGNWNAPGSPNAGQPVLGGQKQWLDKDMPGRNTGA